MLHATRHTDSTALSIAQASAAAMLAADAATGTLDICLHDVAPGYAKVSMAVRPDMLNGHGSCHGGVIFTLADSAFAFACNSYNIRTVGSGCTIDYLAPGRAGIELIAEAHERSRSGKTGVYDVTVTDQDGVLVALFRGKSHQIGGAVIPPA